MAVTYVRDLEQVPVQATIGKTEFEIDDGSGIVERFQSRDYLIHAADLVLAEVSRCPNLVTGSRRRREARPLPTK